MTKNTRTVLIVGGTALVATVVFIAYTLSRPMHHGKWYRHRRAQLDIEMLADVLDQYHTERGSYPTTGQGLELLVTTEFMRAIPKDPWGKPYHYVCPGLHHPTGYDLWSNGADGREGGQDLNKDVNNRGGA